EDGEVGRVAWVVVAKCCGGEGGAVNAAASGLRSDVDYGIAFARRLRIKNLITPHEAQRERIDQRIARVARLKLRFTAEIWDAETVSVRRNPANHALHDGVVLVDLGLCGAGCLPRACRRVLARL